ncbi:hypothetical protein A7Q09_02930 [Methylacidiphilum sp. Yel]|nr:hypothetical protein A7Q09_02930 [Methylacidiphilum sp. Yel]
MSFCFPPVFRFRKVETYRNARANRCFPRERYGFASHSENGRNILYIPSIFFGLQRSIHRSSIKRLEVVCRHPASAGITDREP